jgi:glycosyltransferase involved in cell wall biosynthesis
MAYDSTCFKPMERDTSKAFFLNSIDFSVSFKLKCAVPIPSKIRANKCLSSNVLAIVNPFNNAYNWVTGYSNQIENFSIFHSGTTDFILRSTTEDIDEFKGSLRCLKAFHQINQQYPHWKFKIVGDGQEMQSIINYINSNASIKPKVILRGLLSKPEIADEMQNSDFLVFPSKHESFGLVVTEALSSGLPVIVGNKTAPIEFVDAENGLMVQYDDIHQIAHAIEMMIQNTNNYQAEKIREKVIRNFSFENFGKNLVNTYKSFILKP